MTRDEINRLPYIAQLYINDLQRKIEKIKENIPTELKVKKEMTFEGYLIYKNILKYNGKYFLKGREVDEFSIKFMYNELVN
tara:strand:+ start:143 stop:385 length:243 start_codon:yes stop_codon:yes gene_type:complete